MLEQRIALFYGFNLFLLIYLHLRLPSPPLSPFTTATHNPPPNLSPPSPPPITYYFSSSSPLPRRSIALSTMEVHARPTPTGPWALIAVITLIIVLKLLFIGLLISCYRSRKRARAAQHLPVPQPSALSPGSNPHAKPKTAKKSSWWPLAARHGCPPLDEEARASGRKSPPASTSASMSSMSTVAIPPPMPTRAPSRAGSNTSSPAQGRSRAPSCVSIHDVLVEGDVRRKGYEGWHGGEPLVVITPAEGQNAGRRVEWEGESEKEVVGVARSTGGRSVVV